MTFGGLESISMLPFPIRSPMSKGDDGRDVLFVDCSPILDMTSGAMGEIPDAGVGIVLVSTPSVDPMIILDITLSTE